MNIWQQPTVNFKKYLFFSNYFYFVINFNCESLNDRYDFKLIFNLLNNYFLIEIAILFYLKKIIFYRATDPHPYREYMQEPTVNFKNIIFFLIILFLSILLEILKADMFCIMSIILNYYYMIENAILFNLKKIIFYRATYPHPYREYRQQPTVNLKNIYFF